MKKERSQASWQEKLKKRKDCNKKILSMLSSIVEKYPDLRFWQIIYGLGYETSPDRFYDESYDTCEEIEFSMKENFGIETK